MKLKRLSCFSLYLFPLSLSLLLLLLSAVTITSSAFESDELIVDDEEFGLEGGRLTPLSHSQQTPPDPHAYNTPPSPTPTFTTRRKYSDPDSDSKIHFTLEHAFGDSDFIPAGTFSVRLKTLHHGGQTLTKLRFTRNAFTNADKENFEALLQGDDFYRIRLPSNVLGPPGRDYVILSVKARCLTLGSLDEHFVIHVDGVNILAVNYGTPVACPYPRQMKLVSENYPFLLLFIFSS
uniref:ER membrane protein complex subunit 10 n=1 Tax=Rhizophora mucronata TaxID=61149 RepID=A0A2P2K588_RHIMU